MSVKYEWGEVHARVHKAIESANLFVARIGRVNLRPGATPTELLKQIDDREEHLNKAKAELEAARAAIHGAARRGLRVQGGRG